MKFLFTCPQTGKPFETDRYRVVNNHGVGMHANGRKYLDASVKLDCACPFCNQFHQFHASELSCPFSDERPEHESN